MAGEGSSFVQPAIPRFNGPSGEWNQAVCRGCRVNISSNESLRGSKLKDLKTKNYLFQAINRAILETILKKDTTNDIWDSMKKKYQGTAKVKRAQLQALRKEFEMLNMKVGESVDEYFGRTLNVANKKRINGEKLM
ncbi:unnamed protein product [Prunus armeniaca]